tara:strand:- start:194 stop:349 length:156 start_codon:yes stop_codon:yes gene_type:complete
MLIEDKSLKEAVQKSCPKKSGILLERGFDDFLMDCFYCLSLMADFIHQLYL